MNYYSEIQVLHLLKQQRCNCATISYGKIKMGDISLTEFYDKILNSKKPEMPQVELTVTKEAIGLEHSPDLHMITTITYDGLSIEIVTAFGKVVTTSVNRIDNSK